MNKVINAEDEWKPSEDDIKFCNEAKKELCTLYKEMLTFTKTKDFQDFGYSGSDGTKYSAWHAKVTSAAEKYDNEASRHGCYGMWNLEHTSIFFMDLYTITLNLYGEKQEREKFKKIDSGLSTGFSANLKTVCGQGLW